MKQKTHKHDVVKAARNLIEEGIYDAQELYKSLTNRYPGVDYRVIRDAVHSAKCW